MTARFPKYLVALVLVLVVSPIVLHVLFTLFPGTGSYVVATQSMAPSIPAGSLVYVVGSGEYAVGDVVTFRHDGDLVTHRVVEAEPDHYVTKGDANDGRDAPVPHDRIVGEVVFSVPLYGYFFAVASTPVGYVLLVVVPAALLVGIELRRSTGE